MSKEYSVKQVALTQLYISLGLIALGSIGLIMFGATGEYGANLFVTIALIILTDLFILGALACRYEWLRYSTWGLSIIGFIFAGLAIWIPVEETQTGYIVYADPAKNLTDTLGNISIGFYLLALAALIAGFITLTASVVERTTKISRYAYWVALGAFPLGTIPAAIGLMLQYDSTATFPLQWRFYVSMLVLTVTAFTVVLIAIIAHTLARRPKSAPGQFNQYGPGQYPPPGQPGQPGQPYAPEQGYQLPPQQHGGQQGQFIPERPQQAPSHYSGPQQQARPQKQNVPDQQYYAVPPTPVQGDIDSMRGQGTPVPPVPAPAPAQSPYRASEGHREVVEPLSDTQPEPHPEIHPEAQQTGEPPRHDG